MSLFWEYKVTRQSLKHCGPQSHPWQGWRNGSVTTSSGGLAVFMNVHPVYRSNMRLKHKTSILRCNHVSNVNAKTYITHVMCVTHSMQEECYTHKVTDDWYFTVTHPFSSLSCWYSSNLLFTEFALPANSWCFLELATVMRFVHMVRSETGPAATARKSHR